MGKTTTFKITKWFRTIERKKYQQKIRVELLISADKIQRIQNTCLSEHKKKKRQTYVRYRLNVPTSQRPPLKISYMVWSAPPSPSPSAAPRAVPGLVHTHHTQTISNSQTPFCCCLLTNPSLSFCFSLFLIQNQAESACVFI